MRVLAAIALCVIGSSSARGADAPAFTLQTFRPAVDGKGFVVTNASETLAHLDGSVGFVAAYAYRSLSLEAGGARLDVDHLLTMQLQGALGLLGGARWHRRMRGVSLQLGLSLPVHVLAGARAGAETPRADGDRPFSAQSVGDLGLQLKARLLNTSRHPVGLAVLVGVDLPTGDSARLLGEGQTTLRPVVILDKELGAQRRLRLALNVGAIVRPSRHTFVDTAGTGLARSLGTQVTYAIAAAYAVVPHRLDLVAEVFGAHDLSGARGGSPLEALLAAKVYLAESSYFEIGAGAGLLPPRIVSGDGPAGGRGGMTGEPLARVFIGFTFEPRVGDRDRDGWKDDVDLCPDQPANNYGPHDGCPHEPPPPPSPPAPPPSPPTPSRVIRTGHTVTTFEKVFFKTASAEILPRSFPLLDDLVTLLETNPDVLLLEIAGHADERGDDDYNLRLTEARSNSVRRYLIDHGIDPARLTAHGYGEREPTSDPRDPSAQARCLEHSERCWERNRRVEFRILIPE